MASKKVKKAVKAMTDTERLDWLDGDTDRLEDVKWTMINAEDGFAEGTVRGAIDKLASMKA
jgi:hypothetical protein